MTQVPDCSQRKGSAFTLVEMMVATVILCVILLLVFSITQQTGDAWKKSTEKIQSFQGARAAFEGITRRISQAALNTYYDYYDDSLTPDQPVARGQSSSISTFTPGKYGRCSDLHFITGKALIPSQVSHSIFFQAPVGYTDDTRFAGLDSSLNATGYFIQYSSDDAFRPPFVRAKNRFRLMQFSQPTQSLGVFDPVYNNPNSPSYDPRRWFVAPLSSTAPPAWQLAENIVAMVINPKRSAQDATAAGGALNLTTNYEYDSRTREIWSGGNQPSTQHQLPPIVEVILVAVDEATFARLGDVALPGPPLLAGSLFTDPARVTADLDAFQATLQSKALKSTLFRTEIPIRAAKWSK